MHNIIQFTVEGYDNFLYLIADHNSGKAIAVDPAWDADAIQHTLSQNALTLSAILITHSHNDHVNALPMLYTDDVALFVGEKEAPYWSDCPEDAILVSHGDTIEFSDTYITVITTPGHTPGSCCYHIGDDLITGDTLFLYGCGRADLKNGDAVMLYHSLQKLKELPEHTRIWAGHNYSTTSMTTLGEQLRHNPFLLIDNEKDFVRYRLDIAKKTRQIPYDAVSLDQLKQILQNS